MSAAFRVAPGISPLRAKRAQAPPADVDATWGAIPVSGSSKRPDPPLESEYEDWVVDHPEVLGPPGTAIIDRQPSFVGMRPDLAYFRPPSKPNAESKFGFAEIKRAQASTKCVAQISRYTAYVRFWLYCNIACRVSEKFRPADISPEGALVAPDISTPAANLVAANPIIKYRRVTHDGQSFSFDTLGEDVARETASIPDGDRPHVERRMSNRIRSTARISGVSY